MLRLRQTSNFDDGTPLEYVRTQSVGNRFEIYLEKSERDANQSK